MIGLTSSILDGCQNILVFEIRIVIENFFEASAGPEEFKNISHANTHTAYAGTTTALAVVDDDAAEAFH